MRSGVSTFTVKEEVLFVLWRDIIKHDVKVLMLSSSATSWNITTTQQNGVVGLQNAPTAMCA